MANSFDINMSTVEDALAQARSTIGNNRSSLSSQAETIKSSLANSEGDMAEAVRSVLAEDTGIADKLMDVLNELCGSIQSAVNEISAVDDEIGNQIRGRH